MTLNEVFTRIDDVSIAVVGDFCLDIYWLADMTRSRLSRETPHFPLPVVNERMNCGGAGNVACNVAALKPKEISVYGVVGADWRGQVLGKLLRDAGVATAGLVELDGRFTNAYCKPLRKGFSDVVYEDPRLDFENAEQISESTQRGILDAIKACSADVICVCDQLTSGCIGSVLREGLCDMGKQGRIVLVDSRDRIGSYRNVIVKPNDLEASKVCAGEKDPEKTVRYLSAINGKPAFVTLGDQGCIVCENGKTVRVPGRRVLPPIDICGAGDTFMSALACAIAADCPLSEAALFANTASAVTVKKLFVTGTATREEIATLWN